MLLFLSLGEDVLNFSHGQIQSWTFFGGGVLLSFACESFLILLFAIGNIAIWGVMRSSSGSISDFSTNTITFL